MHSVSSSVKKRYLLNQNHFQDFITDIRKNIAKYSIHFRQCAIVYYKCYWINEECHLFTSLYCLLSWIFVHHRFKHMHIRSNAESIAFYRSGELEMKKTNSRLQVLNSQLIENYFFLNCGYLDTGYLDIFQPIPL